MHQKVVKTITLDDMPERADHVATIQSSYESIVAKLGEPGEADLDPDKTIFSWCVEFRGGCFEVYDYDWQQPKPTKEQILNEAASVDWHIRAQLPKESETLQQFVAFLQKGI